MSVQKSYALQIQHILSTLLDQLQIPYTSPPYDHPLHDACIHGALSRGISLSGPVHIGPYLPVGVSISSNGYSHLPDPNTRVYIALYTAALVAVEDVCGNNIDLLRAFCHQFLTSAPHHHPIMDTYDLLLRELPTHFDPVPADMMLQSNIDFIVANVLEYEMQHRLVSPCATGFPVFLRNLSGAAKIYSLLAYPRNIPVRSYIQAIPASMTYVNFINDIFSFYKEELAHESVNCISNLARCTHRPKLAVLQHLADQSVHAHHEILAVLGDDPADPRVLTAYLAFCRGYVYFHTSSKRYRVPDLWQLATAEKNHDKSSQVLLPVAAAGLSTSPTRTSLGKGRTSITPRIKILAAIMVLLFLTSLSLLFKFAPPHFPLPLDV
ncbi:hypothetical protein APHAL10511_005348 [Amanita phalloides]|nr:hypothetical protein APHAL10511_005348 [Amanita phalloides]